MTHPVSPGENNTHRLIPAGALFPFFLLASCFLWWGLANNLTDPLVRVFRDIFGMSTFQASLIQMAFYGGYFCMAVPGALIARKFTYKTGVLVGLGLYAAGCLFFYPAMLVGTFLFFCIGFYILACGLGILETNANPFILSLGSRETAVRRLNLAQSFNPVGSIAGIFLCQVLIFARLPQDESGAMAILPGDEAAALNIVIFPYLIVAAVLVLIWLLILFTPMPKSSDEDDKVHFSDTLKRLLANRNYVFSVVAQFCYVGTQISVWTFTIFYIPAEIGVSEEVALNYHMAAIVLFGLARWFCTWLMRYVDAAVLLASCSAIAIGLSFVVVLVGGLPGVLALIGISACMSLMFPTIFGLGCAGLGSDSKLASSGQIMAIVGGAILTPLQGALVDGFGASISYLLPLACFVLIFAFAIHSNRLKNNY
jgi:FHS family L-fucose permease-like MFS transporter